MGAGPASLGLWSIEPLSSEIVHVHQVLIFVVVNYKITTEMRSEIVHLSFS